MKSQSKFDKIIINNFLKLSSKYCIWKVRQVTSFNLYKRSINSIGNSFLLVFTSLLLDLL